MTERERVKRRLFRQYTNMLAECEQTIIDAQSCVEWFVVQAAGLRKCLNALKNDERIDESWLQAS